MTLVTGGAGGLGLSVVQAMLDRGDRVWVPWVRSEEAERLRDALPPDAPITLLEADVTDTDRMGEVADRIRTAAGRLDALCNLVGGFTMAPVHETSDADFDRMMALNVRSTFTVTRATIPLLTRSAGGRVVNVAAAPAVRHGGGGMVAYTASKGAVVAMTHALAAELGPKGISVNAIAPTTIDTPANRAAMPAADRTRWVQPAEIASLASWLTSDGARVVTGNVVLAGR
ncbi:SDR family oxidoreductase [Gaopeijia maritima]|uniref:SDR family NAD(P)-dependent oxidoreductase n=1 Tax=Gaopeijia maritima TaxID=3119007 RepID=A0ABU9E8S4_9BACT